MPGRAVVDRATRVPGAGRVLAGASEGVSGALVLVCCEGAGAGGGVGVAELAATRATRGPPTAVLVGRAVADSVTAAAGVTAGAAGAFCTDAFGCRCVGSGEACL